MEEILLDFLKENSLKFGNFRLIDTPDAVRDHKRTDYFVECEN